MTAPATNLTCYARMIESALTAAPSAFTPQAETDDAIQVERGVLFPARLMGQPASTVEPWMARLLTASARDLGSYLIVDQRGHQRPVYRGLLVYAAHQALNLTPNVQSGWRTGLLPWIHSIAVALRNVDWPSDPTAAIPASSGAAAATAAWSALSLHVAGTVWGTDTWRSLAASTISQFARRQLPTGPFLAAGHSDNPETHWYYELVILHAVASFAIQTGDDALAAVAARNAAYHQAATQPDHATNQPWGLPAFIANRTTHSFADQLLHTATTLAGAGGAAVSGITSILLADALYCLRLLLR